MLEFGAGWGFWSRMAKAYGYEVYGFDTSEPRATYARSQGVEYYTSLDEIADESFDFLFSDQVFEHITDPVDALRRVARALRPGGIARIAVPNASGAASLLKKSSGRPLKELRPLEHINGFTYTSLVRALDKVHLKPLTSLFIAKRLIPRVRPTQNAQYLQDALKFCYSQNHGTTIYFIKE